jgi:hypothetical protein
MKIARILLSLFLSGCAAEVIEGTAPEEDSETEDGAGTGDPWGRPDCPAFICEGLESCTCEEPDCCLLICATLETQACNGVACSRLCQDGDCQVCVPNF